MLAVKLDEESELSLIFKAITLLFFLNANEAVHMMSCWHRAVCAVRRVG